MSAAGTRYALVGTTLQERMTNAVVEERLRTNIARAVERFDFHRSAALAELDDPDGLRRAARRVRQEILADLPGLLERFADAALARGAHICWASTADDARDYIRRVVKDKGGRRVVKSKSMVTEEVDLNLALEADGVEVVETDLGEWIVQLAEETPSHIVTPFDSAGGTEADSGSGSDPEELVRFAREHLREVFLHADVGITGANLAVADTGSIVLVTNEGNGRLVTSLPRTHIVVLGMERLAADWQQADLLLALLGRSAPGQRLSSYTTVISGPRGRDELDGPEDLHVVILDNGRGRILGGDHHEMLGCGRCGACLDVSPAYRPVGTHPYGWGQAGPMGAALTPFVAVEVPGTPGLAHPSTLCDACVDASPAEIPLLDMLPALRQPQAPPTSRAERAAWTLWASAWSDPWRYRATTKAATWGRLAERLSGHLPVASSWSAGRERPAAAPERFRDRWRKGLL